MDKAQGGQIVWNLDIEASKFNAGIAAASVKAQALGSGLDTIGSKTFKSFAGNASQAFGSVADSIAGAAMKLTILATAGTVGLMGFVNTARSLQSTNAQFKAIIGNAEEANKVFGELYQYTLGKPIAFPDAAKAAQTLLGYGRTAGQIMGDMKALSAVAIVNGSDLQMLALAYAQVNAKGKLMGQEVIQLVNNKFPVQQALAKSLGISIKEVAARMEEGSITAEMFNKAVADLVPQDKIKEMSNTFDNRLISMQGSLRSFGLSILGLKIDPLKGLVIEAGGLFDILSNTLVSTAKSLKEMTPAIKGVVQFLIDNGSTIKAVLAGVAAAFVVAKVAAIGFAIAANANPISAIVWAITALIAGLVFLEVKFKIFSTAFAALKPIVDPIVAAFRTMWSIMMTQLQPAFKFLSDNIQTLKIIGLILIGSVLLPFIVIFGTMIGAVLGVMGIIAALAFAFRKTGEIIGWYLNKVKNDVMNTVNTIKSFFSNPGQWLYNAGRDLIQGLINGINNKIASLMGTIKKVTDAITGTVKKILGINSPSKVFAGFGENITQGLVQGIGTGMGAVNAAVDGMSNAVISPTVSADVTSGSTSSAAPVNVTLNMSGIMTRSRTDEREIARTLIESLNEELRAKGKMQIGGGAI
jgi:tape measure domain-containing protein